MESYTTTRIDRRNLLKAGAGGLAALALLKTPGIGGEKTASAAAPRPMYASPGPLAWVWRFDADGHPEAVRAHLAANGVGIMYKVFDGTNWMGRYDKRSPMQVHGPADIRAMADFFEAGGVPFHAWGVTNGTDPITEAQMVSDTLNAGARTFTFDLELPEGTNYWHGTPESAALLGQELRRLQPTAFISVAPDARPWQVKNLPMPEFAVFCDDIAPQTYWETFNNSANHRLLAQHGFPVGPEGTTPELILDATFAALLPFGRAIRPVGQGAASAEGWERFAAHASRLGMPGMSVWRYGTARHDIWPVLSRSMAPIEAPAPVEVAPAPEAPQPVVEGPAPAPVQTPVAAAPVAAVPAASTPVKETTVAQTAVERDSERNERRLSSSFRRLGARR